MNFFINFYKPVLSRNCWCSDSWREAWRYRPHPADQGIRRSRRFLFTGSMAGRAVFWFLCGRQKRELWNRNFWSHQSCHDQKIKRVAGKIYRLPLINNPGSDDLQLIYTYPLFQCPDGIAFDAIGRLFVVMAGSNEISILKFDDPDNKHRYPIWIRRDLL